MNWLGAFFIYMVLWWVVLFMVLPFGVRNQEAPEAGHDRGAPAVTHLRRKLIATSLVTLVIWGIGVFLILHYDLSLTMLEHSNRP